MTNLNPDSFNTGYLTNPEFYPELLSNEERAKGYMGESFISQDPNNYFREMDQKNPVFFALFSLYEEKQSEIYEIIRNNDPSVLVEVDNTVPNATLVNIFSDESTYNKDIICLKTRQEIPCFKEDATVESYILQCKKDWNRAQYFSSKYNKYFINVREQPYVRLTPDTDKLFLITIDAINKYFMDDSFYPGLQIDNTEQVDKNIGEISCDCEKLPDNHLTCASFYSLQIPNDKVKKILYNLSAFDQNPKHAILNMFVFGLYKTYKDKYETIIENIFEGSNLTYTINSDINCSYFDSKNKAFISINQIILVVEAPVSFQPLFETFSVPLYNVIKVNPFEMSDYYYTFLYVINEPPAVMGDGSKWYERKATTPITSDFYKFLEKKIKIYMDKVSNSPTDFTGYTYSGADYMSYINKKATEFKKTHKPYVYTYKSPKFVPPEKTPLTSSRLLGGKTRRHKKKSKNKTKKLKKVKKVSKKQRFSKKRSVKRRNTKY
jgi:hypothetical protein